MRRVHTRPPSQFIDLYGNSATQQGKNAIRAAAAERSIRVVAGDSDVGAF